MPSTGFVVSRGLEPIYQSRTVELRMRVVSPTVVVTTMRGRIDRPVARALMAGLDDWMRLGGTSLQAFHDWSEVTDYDSDAREALTPWSKASR